MKRKYKHMKITKKYLTLLVILPFILYCSCTEEEPELAEDITESVVEKIHSGFFEFKVLGGTREEAIRLENDGMDGVYGIRLAELEELEGKDLNLFICINDLKIGILQQVRLKDVTNTFSICRYSVGLSYQEEVRSLLDSAELQRLEIISQSDQNLVSETEFNEAMDQLKEEFIDRYLLIKHFYSDHFKPCTETLIGEIYSILNGQQWQALVSCVDP